MKINNVGVLLDLNESPMLVYCHMKVKVQCWYILQMKVKVLVYCQMKVRCSMLI